MLIMSRDDNDDDAKLSTHSVPWRILLGFLGGGVV